MIVSLEKDDILRERRDSYRSRHAIIVSSEEGDIPRERRDGHRPKCDGCRSEKGDVLRGRSDDHGPRNTVITDLENAMFPARDVMTIGSNAMAINPERAIFSTKDVTATGLEEVIFPVRDVMAVGLEMRWPPA